MGIASVASAMGETVDATLNAQISTALNGIALGPGLVSITIAWNDTIELLSQEYANDTAKSIMPDDTYPVPPDTNPHNGSGPHMAAIASQDQENKAIAQSTSDLVTEDLQGIIGTIKSTSEFLGSNLNNAYEILTPIKQLLQLGIAQIMEF